MERMMLKVNWRARQIYYLKPRNWEMGLENFEDYTSLKVYWVEMRPIDYT